MAELHCRPGSVLCFPVTLSLQEFKCYIIKFALIPQNMDGLWKEKNSSLRQCGCSTYAGVGNIPDNKEMGKYICKEFFIVFDDVFSRKLSFTGSL